MLAREWRSGELGVLLLALTVAVAALTGVGFLVSRISAAVALQASEVLAADLRLGSPQPLAQDYFAEAGRRGQPADQHRGGERGLPAARAGADVEHALRPRHPCRRDSAGR